MKSSVARLIGLLAAALLGGAALPAAAIAQKALVYCPTADATSCGAAVAALGAEFPGGVDKAYDGTNGTLDLKTANLWDYAVFVVPSLADNATAAPYALLRDAAVAERLRDAVMGRVALWSGTPDLGTSNGEAKDALIKGVARWAKANFGAVKGPGLVAFQDLSDDVAARYGWVKGIAGLTLTADTATKSYAAVRTLTGTATAIVGSGASQLAYANMASLGFYLPEGAPGITIDAVGQTGTTTGGQVVLVTSPGGNRGGALVRTDKDDYAPGETVTITGSGFQAGEAVSIVLHEDPQVHANRTLTSTADASGGFVNTSFAPEVHDLGVRFILTATGAASGRQAQTTFTDGPKGATNPSIQQPATTGTGCSDIAAVLPTAVNTALCARSTVTYNSGNSTNDVDIAWFAPANATAASVTKVAGPTAPAANNSTSIVEARYTPTLAGTWTVKVCKVTTACTGQNDNTLGSTSFTITAATSTTIASSKQPATAGDAVTFTATVSPNPATAGTPTGAVQFKVDGANLGAAVTLVGGIAASNPTTTLAVGDRVITAAYAPASGAGFTASSGSFTQTVRSANQAPVAVNDSYNGTEDNTLTVTAPGVLGNDTDADGNPLTAVEFSALSNAAAGTLTANANGGFSFAPAPNFHGAVTFSYKAKDATLTSANAATVTITVAPVADATTTIVTSAPNPSDVGQQATFTATVNSFAPEPVDGTVQFKNGPTNIGSPQIVGAGKATLAYGDLTAGAHAISAVYLPGPSGNFITSTSAAHTHNVSKLTPTITVAANPASVVYGGSVTLTAKFEASGTPVAGKQISFRIGTVSVGTPVLTQSAGGAAIATLAISLADYQALNAAAQPYTVTGSFSGANDPTYGDASGTASLTITQAAQAIDFVAPVGLRFGDADTDLGATATSGLAVAYASATPTVCTIVAGKLHIVAAGSCAVTAAQAGNVNYQAAESVARTFAIAKRTTSITFGTLAFDYDGTAKTTTATAAGVTGSAGITITYDGQPTAPVDVKAGGYPVVASLVDANYEAPNATGTLIIRPRQLAVGAVTVAGKVYDGTTAAAITDRALAEGGVVGSDAVQLSGGLAAFESADAGENKTVNVTGLTLVGAKAPNYVLAATIATATATITRRDVTATIVAKDKIYDRLTTATAIAALGAELVANDAVTAEVTAANFADANAGTGKVVTATLSLAGAKRGNYNLTTTTVRSTAAITPKALVGTVTAADKVYDQSTAAVAARGANDGLAGVIPTDAVTLQLGTATFADKNVGINKTVTVGVTLAGAQAANYSLGETLTATASITAKSVTGSVGAKSKVYDRTTAAETQNPVIDGTITGDVVTLAVGAATFADKNVGLNKDVAVTGLALGGADALNYSLTNATHTAKADITPKGLTATVVAKDKVYDATDVAAVTATLDAGVISPDVVAVLVGTATFSDKNVANGKTVTAALSLAGDDRTNYSLPATRTALASITPATLVGSVTADDKVYDGTTSATIKTRAVSGVLLTDAVALTGGTAVFADKNVATAPIAVAVTGLVLSGTDANNYTVSGTAETAARITPATLTLTAKPQTIIHGGSPDLTGSQVTYAGLVAGEATAGGAPVANVVTGTLSIGITPAPAKTPIPPGSYTLTPLGLTATNYTIVPVTGVLKVDPNADPVVGAISIPNYTSGSTPMTNYAGAPLPLNSSITISSSFTDKDPAESKPYTVEIFWDDNTAPDVQRVTNPGNLSATQPLPITASHPYRTAGVYTVRIRVSQDIVGGFGDRSMTQETVAYVVVYDPSAGFVTGGGWINSPTGAYVANPTLSGKANFGFVSKYQNGAKVPTGNTQFQFHAASFDFKSTVYEWLVVSGTRAQYKGSGTVNGTGDYGFLLTAVDGQPDMFRIKITSKSTGLVVYDNQMGEAEDSPKATAIGGGSIQIHAK